MLGGSRDRQAGKLSAGQKTRVAVAKALINDPDVLQFGEPTASLDPDTAGLVRSHPVVILPGSNPSPGRHHLRVREHARAFDIAHLPLPT